MRAFREEDLDELRDMICTTIEQSYSGTYSPLAIEYFKEYHSPDHIRSDAFLGHTLLVLRNASIVGTGTLLGQNIRRVFVLPGHQGKGIGGWIMAELERKASEDKVATIDLDSSLVSVDFYHHRGYLGDDVSSHELEGGGRLDYVRMTKII